jgi:hypothetical protein
MTCEPLIETGDLVTDKSDDADMSQSTTSKTAVIAPSMPLQLKENRGMGRFVYSQEQRTALLV